MLKFEEGDRDGVEDSSAESLFTRGTRVVFHDSFTAADDL